MAAPSLVELPPDDVSTADSNSDDGFTTGGLLRSWRAELLADDVSTADSNADDDGFTTGDLLSSWRAKNVVAAVSAVVSYSATAASARAASATAAMAASATLASAAASSAAAIADNLSIADIVDVVDRQHPVAAMLSWKRRRSVEEVEEEIAKRGFPITLQLSYTAQQCKAKLLEICELAKRQHQPVYVGTTENVCRRWNGVTKEEFKAWRAANPGAKVREPLRKGHRRLYSRMIAIAHAQMRTHAYYLEPYFIDLARHCCGKYCVNKKSDARGMSSEPQFLYIVVDESGTALDVMKAGDRGLQLHAPKKSPFALEPGACTFSLVYG